MVEKILFLDQLFRIHILIVLQGLKPKVTFLEVGFSFSVRVFVSSITEKPTIAKTTNFWKLFQKLQILPFYKLVF